jgi:uncharacterized protein
MAKSNRMNTLPIYSHRSDDRYNEWPEVGLDLESAIANGWRPSPIREFVIKLSNRCNLACDYCYVFTMADQSWRHRPALITRDTLNQISLRISEHASQHQLRQVRVVLHGGEPLLAGPSTVGYTASVIREQLSRETDLALSLQTNGAFLNERSMEVMHEHQIRIGLSLDGSADHHNRHRKRPNGEGSYMLACRALNLLNSPPHRTLFGGLLCTIDIHNEPSEVYRALREFDPPMIDFLLPHGTWSSPPPGRNDSGDRPYSRWLSAIFDNWYSKSYDDLRIRLFDEIIRLLHGECSRSDQVGLSPATFLIVDTDGSLQQADALKASYAGAPEMGLNVFDHSIDDALTHPAILARQLGLTGLASECRQCSIVAVCGGGHYPHRYRRGKGFLNPSVYCPDLRELIGYIADTVRLGSAWLARTFDPWIEVN